MFKGGQEAESLSVSRRDAGILVFVVVVVVVVFCGRETR